MEYSSELEFEGKIPDKTLPEEIYVYKSEDSFLTQEFLNALREEYKEEVDRNGSARVLVRLSSVYEYYPLEFTVLNRGSQSSGRIMYQDPELYEKLKGYFRFPIDGSQSVVITLYKNDQAGINWSGAQTGPLYVDQRSLTAGGYLYFYMDMGYASGTTVDWSLVPGGRGLYRLSL